MRMTGRVGERLAYLRTPPTYLLGYPPETRVGQKYKRLQGVRAWIFPVATLPEGQHWVVDSVWTKIEPSFWREDVDACEGMHRCGRTEAVILVDSQGPRWFVWSQLPITCLRGSVGWLEPTTDKVRSCIGKPTVAKSASASGIPSACGKIPPSAADTGLSMSKDGVWPGSRPMRG
jgi:hypothetical protein